MSSKTTTGGNGRGSANPRVTLRTIAEVTGLSLSTVSLSLRGGTTLKQETRDKVAEAAKALGYIPDRAGVRLRTGKTNVIALVLDGAEDSIDFARQMIQGIGNAIKGTRYHLTVIPEFERNLSADTIRYILDNRTADQPRRCPIHLIQQDVRRFPVECADKNGRFSNALVVFHGFLARVSDPGSQDIRGRVGVVGHQ